MSPLSRDAKAIVDAARHEGPPADAKSRVRAALAARIAIAPGASSPPSAATSTKALTGSGIGSLPSIAALALFFATGAGLGLLAGKLQETFSSEPPPPPAAAVDPAPEPSAPFALPVATPVHEAPPPAPAAAQPRSTTPSPRASLSEEMLLLGPAQIALREGRAADALGPLADHARRFPRGVLAREREGLRAIALCTLGRPEGPSVAERAIRRDPSTPLARRIATACDLAATDPPQTGH